MKYGGLLKIAKQKGWYLSKHGKKHDIYRNDDFDYFIVIPRHSKEIPYGTAISILKRIEGK